MSKKKCPPIFSPKKKNPQIFTGLPWSPMVFAGIRMVASLQNGSMAWSGEEATLGKWRRDVWAPGLGWCQDGDDVAGGWRNVE